MVVAVAADAVPSFGSIATTQQTNTNQQTPTQQTDTQQTTEQQQQQTPTQNNTQSTTPATHTKKTNVDGKGMWRHWKRNFTKTNY